MRKSLLAAIAAATAMVPAAAFAQEDQPHGRWHQREADTAGGGEQHAPRPFQPSREAQPQQQPRFERPQTQAASQAQAQAPGDFRGRDRGQGDRGSFQRPDRGQFGGQLDAGTRFREQQQAQQQQQAAQAEATRQQQARRGDWNRGDRSDFHGGPSNGQPFDRGRFGDRGNDGAHGFEQRHGFDQRGSSDQRGFDRRDGNRGDWTRGGYDQRGYGDRNNRGAWNRDWRQDRRYDWNRYRTENRSLFRLPRYYAPYGWNYGYRRFSIGFRLNALLFAQNYWIDDPYEYQLPPVYGPYRWVRYYNDALLVDTYSGEVVDTVYDIFW